MPIIEQTEQYRMIRYFHAHPIEVIEAIVDTLTVEQIAVLFPPMTKVEEGEVLQQAISKMKQLGMSEDNEAITDLIERHAVLTAAIIVEGT